MKGIVLLFIVSFAFYIQTFGQNKNPIIFKEKAMKALELYQASDSKIELKFFQSWKSTLIIDSILSSNKIFEAGNPMSLSSAADLDTLRGRESYRLRLFWDTWNKKGKFSESTTLIFKFSNGLEQRVALRFEGEIQESAKIKFERVQIDTGDVMQGPPLSFEFPFKNIGNKDLVIMSVRSSGGGAYPKHWPKEPIMPGKSGKIVVGYLTKDRRGHFNKTISVKTNALREGEYGGNIYLKIKGAVRSREQMEQLRKE